MGRKEDAEPLEPLVLIRHVRRFLLARPEVDGLLQRDLSEDHLWGPNDALRVFALVLHEALLRPEVLQASTADMRILEARRNVASFEMFSNPLATDVSSFWPVSGVCWETHFTRWIWPQPGPPHERLRHILSTPAFQNGQANFFVKIIGSKSLPVMSVSSRFFRLVLFSAGTDEDGRLRVAS